MNQFADYIIVGQGLAGSALAWELMQQGKSVVVFDQPSNNRASAKAAGLYNPVTGRVMTKTWRAEAIFSVMEDFYGKAEAITGQKFLFEKPVYRPFNSLDEQQQWEKKSEDPILKDFILKFHKVSNFNSQVRDTFGGIEIAHSGYLDVGAWLSTVRDVMKAKGCYHEVHFQEEYLSAGEQIEYHGIKAGHIIFCNGLAAIQSSWFHWLPLKPLKGETLEVKIDFTPQRIYNRGVFLVPTSLPDRHRVGATYQHEPFSEGTTDVAREKLKGRLTELITHPFEIVHQDWGIRPTTPDRRPMLGSHPMNKKVLIFNGLGTKGVSLAPYFARQLAHWLGGKGDLDDEVNIYRFKALYSR